LILFGAKSGG
jgi:dynein heavy chain